MSGLDATTLEFAPYESDPKLSVAALPTSIDYSTIVKIDGKRMWLSSYPTTRDHYWPDNDTVTYTDLTEMQGSDTHWAFTDHSLNETLRKLDPKTAQDMLIRMFGYPNLTYTMNITSFDRESGVLKLDGRYNLIPLGRNYTSNYHLFNNPAFINEADQYAVVDQGTRLVAPVAPGPHLVEMTARPYGVCICERSNITIDGFTLTGYAGNIANQRGGTAIGEFVSGPGNAANVAITNNNMSDLAGWGGGYAVGFAHASNITITGNTVGPTLLGKGIGINKVDKLVIDRNRISHVGWSGIDLYNDHDVAVTLNRIEHLEGTHSAGIAVYLQNENVIVANNQFDGVVSPITVKGNGAPDPQRPNNVSITNNVVTNARAAAIASWGAGLVGLSIHGNILLTSTQPAWGIQFNKNMENVTATNNILDGMAMGGPVASNWAVTGNVLTEQYNPKYFVVPPGNQRDMILKAKLLRALEHPGALPQEVCNIISPAKGHTQIGIDFYCVDKGDD